VLCILSAVSQLRALLYVLCAFVILNKDYLLTYLLHTRYPITKKIVADDYVGGSDSCAKFGENSVGFADIALHFAGEIPQNHNFLWA